MEGQGTVSHAVVGIQQTSHRNKHREEALRTGKRKITLIKMLGVMFHGGHFIIHLICFLTANQVIGFIKGNKSYGTLQTFNPENIAGITAKY